MEFSQHSSLCPVFIYTSEEPSPGVCPATPDCSSAQHQTGVLHQVSHGIFINLDSLLKRRLSHMSNEASHQSSHQFTANDTRDLCFWLLNIFI